MNKSLTARDGEAIVDPNFYSNIVTAAKDPLLSDEHH